MNKFIYTFLLIAFSLSTILAQEALTALESGSITKPVEYIGTHDNQLYYLEYDGQDYVFRRESLSDTELESITIESFSLEDYQFSSYALTAGKVALVTADKIIRYDIDLDDFTIIDISMFDTSDQPIFSEGKGYWPIGAFELLVIDLQNGETSVRTHDLEFTFDRFAFNDDETNVLPGSKVAVAHLNESQSVKGLMEYDLADGSASDLYLFDQFDIITGPFSSNNGAYIPIINNDLGEYKLLSMINEGNSISFSSQPLGFNPTDRVIYANNEYAYIRTTNQNGGITEIIHQIQDISTGDVSTIAGIDQANQRIVRVTKDGVYISQDNELILLGVDGSEQLIFDELSNGDVYFLRDEDFRSSPTVEGKFVANYRLDNGDRFYTLVSPSGASASSPGQVITYVFDEVTTSEYVIRQSSEFENQFAHFENTFSPITEDESKSPQGGIFSSTNNKFVYTRNSAFKRKLYDLSGAFQNYSMPSFSDVSENYTRIGDKVLATGRFISTPGRIIDLSSQSSESFSFNAQGESVSSVSDFIDGKINAKAVVAIDGNPQLATIDAQGVITSFVNETDPLSTALLPLSPFLQSTMDLAIGLRGDINTGIGQLVAIGNELEEPKIILDNFNIFSSGPITVIEEGTSWSYMSVDRYFFIDENAEIIEAPFSDEVPVYNEGKFYFSDKYFDEGSGEFVNWDSGLSSIQSIVQNVAYGYVDDKLASLNLATMELLEFDNTNNDLEFYIGKEGVIIYNPSENKVLWTDGFPQNTVEANLPSDIELETFRIGYGDRFLFAGESTTAGSELFALNRNGEIETFDINGGMASSNPDNYVVNSDFIYFTAYNEDSGIQIYSFNLERALSTEDQKSTSDLIDVYPNPTADRITIDGKIEFELARVYNHQGLMYESQMNKDNTINLENLPAGQYFIELVKNGIGTGTAKVIRL